MKKTFKRKPFGPTLKYNQIPRQNPHLKKKKNLFLLKPASAFHERRRLRIFASQKKTAQKKGEFFQPSLQIISLKNYSAVA